ncbi:MAG TPA: isoaspartyl peptidase/L-asparaginase [Pyrinomonadaceae bacterium]
MRPSLIGLLISLFIGSILLASTAGAQVKSEKSSVQETGSVESQTSGGAGNGKIVFAIHGGAGTIERGKMTAEREKQYRAKLEEALKAGYQILQRGGNSLDAVEAAIRLLEDSPLFNAGKGAVFTSAGTNELDASIMEGKTLKAGAVASLKHIKNPISLARMVMEKSPHVMMVGEGAETFAQQQGVQFVDQKYFFTEQRWNDYLRIKEAEQKKADQEKQKGGAGGGKQRLPQSEHHFGTVGAVALDKNGNLAAGTSTGGISNKKFGRVGDSPIIGAGTYANNRTCAVSATGDGEYFIRSAVAHDISALMEYRGLSASEAARTVIDKVGQLGGGGGVIVLDKDGNIAMHFNTSGMYRGYIDASGKMSVEIYKD